MEQKMPIKNSLPQTKSATSFVSGRRYLNEHELADRLGLSVQFLRKRRDRGEPPYHSKFGRRVRYSIAEVERYEAAALQDVRPPHSHLPTRLGRL